MTDEQQRQAAQYQRHFRQLMGNPLDALNQLGAYAAAARQPSKFEKARDYAASVRARKPEMQVRRMAQ